MAPSQDIIDVANFRSGLRQFLRQSEKVAARHGLTPQRYLLLLMIKGAPDGSERSTVTELTARLQLAQHTVTELVARAEAVGLVKREASRRDQRISHIALTTRGERKLKATFRELEPERQALHNLTAAIGDGRRARRARNGN